MNEIQDKIAKLKNSMKKLKNNVERLKKLTKAAEIGELLAIEDLAHMYAMDLISALRDLEITAHKKTRELFPSF